MLCRISPLGAAVAIVTCIVRCLFTCGAIRYAAAMLFHDSVMGVWHWIFGPPRVRAEIVEPRNVPGASTRR